MPTDEAAPAEVRQANARYHDGYERRLAAEIVAMLPSVAIMIAIASCTRDMVPSIVKNICLTTWPQ
jgi:hypothetical protein